MLTQVSISIALKIILDRSLAFLSSNFSHEFWHQVAGQFGTDFCNQFTSSGIAHFEVGNSVGMVQLVQVVGEYTLRKQLLAKCRKGLGAIVDALQKNALVQESPAAKAQLSPKPSGILHPVHPGGPRAKPARS